MRLFFTFLIALSATGLAYGQEYRLVGKLPAPSMVVNDVNGNKLDTREFAGKTVVYNLWFVGCPPCMEEIPRLNTIVDEFPNVVFVGLSTSSAADISKFVSKQPFKYRLVPAAGKEMLMNFGLADKSGVLNIGFPTHVVVNANGYIEFRGTGVKSVDGIRDALTKLATAK